MEQKETSFKLGSEFLNGVMDGEVRPVLAAIVWEISEVSIAQADATLTTTAATLQKMVAASDDGKYTVTWATDKTTYEELVEAMSVLTTTNLKSSIEQFEEVFIFVFQTLKNNHLLHRS